MNSRGNNFRNKHQANNNQTGRHNHEIGKPITTTTRQHRRSWRQPSTGNPRRTRRTRGKRERTGGTERRAKHKRNADARGTTRATRVQKQWDAWGTNPSNKKGETKIDNTKVLCRIIRHPNFQIPQHCRTPHMKIRTIYSNNAGRGGQPLGHPHLQWGHCMPSDNAQCRTRQFRDEGTGRQRFRPFARRIST